MKVLNKDLVSGFQQSSVNDNKMDQDLGSHKKDCWPDVLLLMVKESSKLLMQFLFVNLLESITDSPLTHSQGQKRTYRGRPPHLDRRAAG